MFMHPNDIRDVVILITLITVVAIASDAKATTCRNPAVKHAFDVSQGYPHGRKGYIVDHLCALSCGGIDAITNMQYQTSAASKLKDRWESTTAGCKQTCNPQNSTSTRQVYNCK